MAYTAEQKALAIALVQRHGGMTSEALAAVEAVLGKRVSTGTLHNWLSRAGTSVENETENETEKRTRSPVVTPAVQAQAERALDDIFEDVARKYLAHATKDTVIADTRGKEAIIAAATAVDKMRLLRDMPTEIIGLMPGVIAALNAAGMDVATTFERLIQRAEQKARERASVSTD